jgi:nucleoid DNA-binding protein
LPEPASLSDFPVATAKLSSLIKAAANTFAALARAIKKDKRFQMSAFGSFSVKSREARMGRNPRTGEVINIKASRTVGFNKPPSLKKAR